MDKSQKHMVVEYESEKKIKIKLSEEEIEAIVIKKLQEINPNYRTVITFDIDYTGGHI